MKGIIIVKGQDKCLRAEIAEAIVKSLVPYCKVFSTSSSYSSIESIARCVKPAIDEINKSVRYGTQSIVVEGSYPDLESNFLDLAEKYSINVVIVNIDFISNKA